MAPNFLSGGGDMGALMRAHDWPASPLGPPETWPHNLRSAVGLMLASKFPMFLAWGPELTSLYNDAYIPVLGHKHPRALGLPFAQVWSEIWDDIRPLVDRALAGEATYHRDLPLTMRRRGFYEQTYFTFSYSPVHDETGAVAGMFCACTETTEKVAAERRFAFQLDLAERLRGLSDPAEVTMVAAEALGQHLGVACVGYAEVDENGEVVSVERGWTDGSAPSFADQTHVLDAFGPAVATELRAGRTLVMADCMADPRSAGKDYAATWASIGCRSLVVAPLVMDGRLRAVLFANDPKPRHWSEAQVSLVEDVAERTWTAVESARAVSALRTSERRLKATRDNAGVGIHEVDQDGRSVSVNDAFTRMTGYTQDDLVGRIFFDFIADEEDRRATRADFAALVRGDIDSYAKERLYTARDGRAWWAEVTVTAVRDEDGRFVHAVRVVQDITARKNAEAELRSLNETLEHRVAERTAEREAALLQLAQMQKMETVGQLTGGVAHDFNNLLQALSGCLAMIGRRTNEPEVRPLLEAGQQAVDRGAKLVRQLMAFARRESLRPEPIDLRGRLAGMSELLARAIRADINLATDLAPDLWPVEVDPTQFELALINLAVNARDAMPAGGDLRIEAVNVHLPPSDPSGLAGDFVRLSVRDTGSGMPEDVAARAFEPFYTTKEIGKGSGLGLSQVYGLARQAGGAARIESVPGRGTNIVLLLRRSATPAAAADEAVHPVAATARRRGSMLLVEDDEVVATTVAAAMEDAGYAVAWVATADEALSLLESGTRFDLVFSDMVMPGRLSGLDLAQAARRLRPDLPVVLTTGYSEKLARVEGVTVLAKPYRIDELVRTLDAAAPPRPDPQTAGACRRVGTGR